MLRIVTGLFALLLPLDAVAAEQLYHPRNDDVVACNAPAIAGELQHALDEPNGLPMNSIAGIRKEGECVDLLRTARFAIAREVEFTQSSLGPMTAAEVMIPESAKPMYVLRDHLVAAE